MFKTKLEIINTNWMKTLLLRTGPHTTEALNMQRKMSKTEDLKQWGNTWSSMGMVEGCPYAGTGKNSRNRTSILKKKKA